MFSFRLTLQFFPSRITAVFAFVVLGMKASLIAQVHELPVDARSNLNEQSSSYSTAGNKFTQQSRMNPCLKRVQRAEILPLPQSDLLKRRIKVNISNTFRAQKIDSIVRKFETLMSKQLSEAESPSDRVFPGSPQRIVLGTSGFWEREGFWQAHLQKADFELMAAELSLNDINRFQFRKNRRHGDQLPIHPAAGGSRIIITD